VFFCEQKIKEKGGVFMALGPMDPKDLPAAPSGLMDPKPGISSGEPFPTRSPVQPSPTLLDGRRLIKEPGDLVREVIRWPRW